MLINFNCYFCIPLAQGNNISVMKKEIIITEDGSHTILLPDLKVTYHSTHGSVQESNHVYIKSGLEFTEGFKQYPIRIFEMGFGTGLNALLTCLWADKHNIPVQYTTIDLYPITIEEADTLNYQSILKANNHYFHKIHVSDWEMSNEITDVFHLTKKQVSLTDFDTTSKYNLIYFDAFDPSFQPELWTTEVFIKLYHMLSENGVLVTYSSKSDVRRSMQSAGFTTEKLQGPLGKREILRAIKSHIL